MAAACAAPRRPRPPNAAVGRGRRDVPPEIRVLAERRAASAGRDFAPADALRDGSSRRDGRSTTRRRRRFEPGAADDRPRPHGRRAARSWRSRRRPSQPPLGRRGMAEDVDRRWTRPVRRRRPRPPVRRRRRDGRAPRSLGPRRRGGLARAGHRLGGRSERRPASLARRDGPRAGRLGGGDGRCAVAARGRARRPHGRRVRTVRPRDRGPPRVPRVRGVRRLRRGRGLPDGVPPLDAAARRWHSTSGSAGTGAPTSSGASASATRGFASPPCRRRSCGTSTGCGRRRARRSGSSGHGATSGGSSIGGGTGGT